MGEHQVRREISFQQTDLFLERQEQETKLMATGVQTRDRQGSNITAHTVGSTQHSDDHQMGGSSCSPVEGRGMRRNLSNPDRDLSNMARSRGISGVSGDSNLVARTQTSASSNELSLLNQQTKFADKVRLVAIQEPTTPEHPNLTSEMFIEEAKESPVEKNEE